jgi:hypothetical protein
MLWNFFATFSLHITRSVAYRKPKFAPEPPRVCSSRKSFIGIEKDIIIKICTDTLTLYDPAVGSIHIALDV